MSAPSNINLSSLNGSNGFKLSGTAAYDFSGASVASAGDVNGDGFADLIVGASGADPHGNSSGASYVVFGKASGFTANVDLSSLNGSNGFKLSGAAADDYSGFPVASAGDVNGDGFADLIIGAKGADPHGSYSGASYVLFGKASGFGANLDLSSLNGSNGFKLSGVAQGNYAGRSVASAGDVNGDGFADLIVGAFGASPHGTASGASYVVFGKASGFATNLDLSGLDGSNGFKLSGAISLDNSGFSVASAGDFNGDGFADLIIGAKGADPHGSYSGASYVVFGKASGFGANLDLSSLDGTNGFKLSGASANDQSGRSVASAGDVNGDGYDDLIVGAPEADPYGRVSAGASYVVFGKASGFTANFDLWSLTGTTGFKLSGDADQDISGWSVASAGDVNGDGFGDLIVGASHADPNGSFSGASYVVFGKASGFAANLDLSTLNGINGFKLSGVAAGDESGQSVAAAGDVNGDGFADLIIGATGADPHGSSSGASYVVFGGAFGATVTTTGTSAAEMLIGGAGGDALSGGGGADVFHGGAGDDRLTVADTTFRLADGGTGNDTLAMAGAGQSLDLADRQVAARLSGVERIDLTGSGNNTLKIEQRAVLDGIGAVVGGKRVLAIEGNAGDKVVFADGAWSKTDSFTDAHGTFDRYTRGDTEIHLQQGIGIGLAFNLSSLDGSNGFKLSGVLAADAAGLSVASAGDVNGDGFADVIVSASGADLNGTNSGASYVVFGKASGFTANVDLSSLNGANGFKLSGVTTGDFSGWSVASAGDVNGDGFADVIVGAKWADPNGSDSGASYVVFGKASGFAANVNLQGLNGSNGFRLSGVASSDYSGWSVASAGDVNGDGFADMIVGATYADPHGNRSGASYVVFGKASGFAANLDLSSLNGGNGFKLSGAAAYDYGGRSVASAGDVNGDGFADVIVGAPLADPNGRNGSGASYVVFGKASGFGANLDLSSLNGSNGFKLSGAATSDASGISVASAGDVNGDGFSDLIVGAPGADPHGLSSGASYVVFGRASGFAANLDLSSLNGGNGFKLSGEAAYDLSGLSVASAGDVNGDGFADLIVGAYAADPHGGRSGASYVVFGKASGFTANLDLSTLNGSQGFKLSGVAAYDSSSFSVASAGDVNGDGFSDLIIGAPYADPHGNYSGASYVVFGGAFGATVTTTGTSAAEMLIGGAGDDTLSGGGGADVFHGGAGDDRLTVANTTFRLADGGTGNDTLVLAGAGQSLNLADRQVAVRLQGIERIDLTGSGNNALTVNQRAVLDGLGAVAGGKHVLTIERNVGDTVTFADGAWSNIGSFTDAHGTFDRYVLGDAEVDLERDVGTVGDGQSLTIQAGQTSGGLSVLDNGTLYVNSGGTAVGATISAGGLQYVFSGGVDSGAHVLGERQIWGGGTASGGTVDSGGTEYLYGVASGTKISSGGTQYLDLGGVANGGTIDATGWQHVFGHAIASGMTVSSSGNQHVFSAGSSVNTVLQASAWETVWGGGVASGTSVSGGYLSVFSGGTTSNTIVSSGGWEFAWGGGMAIGTVVSSGGYLDVYSGGAAVGATLLNGAWDFVWGAGTTATGTVVSSGGYEDVYSGGSAINATVRNGGWQFVWGAGTTATGTVVSSGGYQDVYSGGTATGTVVGNGGWELAWTGGSVSGSTVTSGGIEFVWSDASAANTTVSSGGILDNYGSTTGTKIHNGGL